MKKIDVKNKIIQFFNDNQEEFVSGEAIANLLGCSRAGIWKHIEKLRGEGYIIKAVPHKGYKLKSVPDKMYASSIVNELNTKVIGKGSFYYHDEVTSTNDEAYQLAENGEEEGTIVISETQTAGKGRVGRKWSSPKGEGIYASIILRPEVNIDIIPTITLISALAIVEAVRKVCSLEAKIKWPNDVYLQGKKLCGILTEIKAQPDMVDFIVMGLGVNINTPLDLLPEGATSLKFEVGESVSRNKFLKILLEEFESDYNIFKKEGFLTLREECKEHSYTLGKRVEVKQHTKTLKGEAVDIDETGALIIKDENGKLNRVFSGDVSMCRGEE